MKRLKASIVPVVNRSCSFFERVSTRLFVQSTYVLNLELKNVNSTQGRKNTVLINKYNYFLDNSLNDGV